MTDTAVLESGEVVDVRVASSSTEEGQNATIPIFQLRFQWVPETAGTPARGFVVALASLLFGRASEVIVVDQDGDVVDDLDLTEVASLLRETSGWRLRCRVPVNGVLSEWEVQLLEPAGSGTGVVEISVGTASGSSLLDTDQQATSTGVEYLAANPEVPSPIPVVGLPIKAIGIDAGACHALVALAYRFGLLSVAELHGADSSATHSVVAQWSHERQSSDAVPVYQVHETLWVAQPEAPSAAVKPSFWVQVVDASRPSKTEADEQTDNARSRLLQLLNGDSADLDAAADVVRSLLPDGTSIEVVPLAEVAHPHYMAPPQDGVVLVLAPGDRHVTIGVDPEQTPQRIADALLHASGHLVLGHVRPGDAYGHWDTAETIGQDRPRRRWDRKVRESFADWFAPPATRKVTSLDECTPTEKAQLGLWRMIGEMLGESRRLHSTAERYQKAAYQRQAAQRLVAMLEDYSGAMLCDGVGLGKTYVATTVLAHYANMWQERYADEPDVLLEDPFRITILSPNSVVSTWQREAIPPLSAFGVPLSNVRVVSHTKLSRITRSSDVLAPGSDGLSDLEHLLLSDLVVVDEAHNFRSINARRTVVLRDLLRLQPRKDQRRRVLLLTATPINNSLEDLRQETSLLFARPLWLSNAKTDDGYRRQAVTEVHERCAKARAVKSSQADVAALVIHGSTDGKFSQAIDFRDDLDFGTNVQRIGDYLKEQDKKLRTLQDRIRDAARVGETFQSDGPVRIAEDLLDRVIVQRSRALCKEIERQQGSQVELLFRPDPGPPEKLYYSDEYDGIEDVLARFLPLFDHSDDLQLRASGARALSLKVYMWYDVREGLKEASEVSPVVGLQRVLVLKRLESSPVSFLLTLLRLTVLHTHRIQELFDLCHEVGDHKRAATLQAETTAVLNRRSDADLDKIQSLATGSSEADPRHAFVKRLSLAYNSSRSAADPDDSSFQFTLFAGAEGEEAAPKKEQLDRLWTLREAVLQDLETLLLVTPDLADVVFGRFNRDEWPHRFIAGGEAVDWPDSAGWGLRLITDAKLRKLIGRLLLARRNDQKVIVFSQFSDTIAYVNSVLRATRSFTRQEWGRVLHALEVPDLQPRELDDLLRTTVTVTGDTEDRDEVINSFAPFYRIGPHHPVAVGLPDEEQRRLVTRWEESWSAALTRPVHVVLSTDVLAEGVNLQDVAVLINFDVHWNPVRMIQRAGRIDRRLSASIENAAAFPELEALAVRLGVEPPRYYWHEHRKDAALTVNMILPDELEAELLLRERIATKTLAIDFTLGLEQGTGAEAEWMESYKYQGISSLNSFQKDRAIERVASYHEKLTRVFAQHGIKTDWAENLNRWLRAETATAGSPLIARARLGRKGGDLEVFTRYLEPLLDGGVPYWAWTEKKPGESLFDGWLILDGRPENFPPRLNRVLPWHDTASVPLRASHLLAALIRLENGEPLQVLPNQEIGRPLMQGATAIAAPKLGSEDDRRSIQIRDFFLLQLPDFDTEPA